MAVFSSLKTSITNSVNKMMNRKSKDISLDKNELENIHSTTSQNQTKSKIFFWGNSNKCRVNTSLSTSNNSSEINSPDSSKSVYFQECITWPYIDEDC
ncbi:Hypothetical protein SRAE_X000160300 [Strongyloides ratti]|uniref:Uncharacterized protein n=1 Tax=Strongyloides ratti TaxID=34506 RepID=A0A090KR55_STRRB|nr:Hypothetical protein SRAE_X000160300 [Strongyloides ratti]CEF59859.1 Hypothetical protein SRAE_X000160300 [Strongyloides ratti]